MTADDTLLQKLVIFIFILWFQNDVIVKRFIILILKNKEFSFFCLEYFLNVFDFSFIQREFTLNLLMKDT